MRKRTAVLGSTLFFVFTQGVGLGLIPWLITGWRFQTPAPFWAPLRVLGVVLIASGVIVVLDAFVRFVVEGFGTPFVAAPPQHLVVTGFFRWVRNPIYVAFLAAVLGETLLFGQFWLLLYGAIWWMLFAISVHWWEEPDLARRFGAEWDAYRRAVPAWWPRLRPWNPTAIKDLREPKGEVRDA